MELRQRQGYSIGQLLLAFAGGAAAGAATAILMAPRSGAETRRRIKERARDKRERIGRIPSQMREAYHSAAGAAQRRFGSSHEQR